MKEEEISIRNFLRNYSMYSKKNKPLIILNHGKKEGVYLPYEQWEKTKRRKFNLKDLEKIQFHGGGKLSQQIDEIVYQNTGGV